MPNGDPKFHETELPKLDAFFARFADALTAFATERGLRIERYYHQLPSWEFCFKHPAGGSAYVEMRRVDDDVFRLHSAWWIDDRRNRKRRSHHVTSQDYRVEGTDIRQVLAEAYDAVQAWKREALTRVSDL